MNREDAFVLQMLLDESASIKGTILEWRNKSGWCSGLRTNVTAQSPKGAVEATDWWRNQLGATPAARERQCQAAGVCIAIDHIIEDTRPARLDGPRPGPALEGLSQRFAPSIAVHIGKARPTERGTRESHLDPGMWCDRLPDMSSLAINRKGGCVGARGLDDQGTFQTPRNRHGHFIDIDVQSVVAPCQTTLANFEASDAAVERGSATLRHGPAMSAVAIERNIDRAMRERVPLPTPAGSCIVWRKDATDKGDDGQAVPAVVAQRIDIPPGIATGWNRRVERWSVSTVWAAMRPDSAAIARPGPGWIPPPAR